MDAEKHIKERDRLNQTLNGKLPEICSELRNIMEKYNIDSMPGTSADVFKYVIEESYLDRLNLQKYWQ